MTISTTTIKNSYSGDGSQTVFAYTFKILADADIQVIIRAANGTETVKTLTTDYTVSGAGTASGGNVTFGTAPTATETVVLRRETTQTQTVDLVENDPFTAETVEGAFDRSILIAQELQEEVDRSIKLSRTNTMTSTEFSVDAATRANKILAFDSSGEIAVTQELGTFTGNWAGSTAYYVRDIIKDTSNNNIYICNTAHTSSGAQPISSNTDSAKWDLLVDAASATSSASAAATSATAAASSATAAASSATAAAASETAAAASETAAAASETAAAASESAAATSESNAATSETNAASSASAAATSATATSTSATNAASSATAAATSATSAAGSAVTNMGAIISAVTTSAQFDAFVGVTQVSSSEASASKENLANNSHAFRIDTDGIPNRGTTTGGDFLPLCINPDAVYYGTYTLKYISGTVSFINNSTLNIGITGSANLDTSGMSWNNVNFSHTSTTTLISNLNINGLLTTSD